MRGRTEAAVGYWAGTVKVKPVTNAIVLIDYINTLRDRGLELTVAIAEAAGHSKVAKFLRDRGAV